MQNRKHNHKPLFGIILVFVIPILLAHTLYHSGYGKKHHNSRGTLLSPPIKIDVSKLSYWQIASMKTPSSNPKKFDTLKKRLAALGKDYQRVHLTLINDPSSDLKTNPDWKNVRVQSQTMKQLQETRSKNAQQCTIFIINPNNDAIICYDENNDLRDIDFDLRKLLRLSQI